MHTAQKFPKFPLEYARQKDQSRKRSNRNSNTKFTHPPNNDPILSE